ncbi:RTA1 like protein-domain-containing protein [Dactylonectria macrodidyma]|uniref:RTA1 like protein-domain-containing protein n=1 Tax=Dactylonectria macrodidyma TaxID=307937 RepID=A0A9P9E825_9HYPO|nr:RTA1 like protein-domain-containing protein [Dactylonectria macrodidyma]
MAEFKLYQYDPSLTAAIVFLALFCVSTMAHLYQLVRSKTWFLFPFFIGCAFESIGYIGRLISATQTPNWAIMPYVLQSLLLLLGPTMLAASIYMLLSRLAVFLDASHYSLVPVENLSKTFVWADVISFLAQSGGGGMLANAKSAGNQKMGRNIIILGLAIQIYFFGFFITILHVFHRRIINNPTQRSLLAVAPWRRFILVLYAGSGLIMIRSVFRIVEYITGTNGKLQSSEIYIYAFDASMILITTALFNVFHPSRMAFATKDETQISPTDNHSMDVHLETLEHADHTVTESVHNLPAYETRKSLLVARYDDRRYINTQPTWPHHQPQPPFSRAPHHPCVCDNTGDSLNCSSGLAHGNL